MFFQSKGIVVVNFYELDINKLPAKKKHQLRNSPIRIPVNVDIYIGCFETDFEGWCYSWTDGPGLLKKINWAN